MQSTTSTPSAAHTRSAASSAKLPSNTASRRNTRRSSRSSSAWLQSIDARRVRCRGSPDGLPVRNRVNLPSRPSAIWRGVSAGTRPAASSIASGIPSSPRQIWTTAAALRSSSRKDGSARPARSTNSRTESARIIRAVSPASSGSGTDSDGTRHRVSSGRPSGSRLVASIRSCRQPASRISAMPAHASIRCSQLSRMINGSRPPRWATSASDGARADRSRSPSAAATAAATDWAALTPARSTHHTPAGVRSANAAPTASARRVFPHPPAPTRVTSRERASSRRTVPTSRPRPTNRVRTAGRLPGVPAAPGSAGDPMDRAASTAAVRPRCGAATGTSTPTGGPPVKAAPDGKVGKHQVRDRYRAPAARSARRSGV